MGNNNNNDSSHSSTSTVVSSNNYDNTEAAVEWNDIDCMARVKYL